MSFRAFIENEAGSNRKNHHDERSLTFQRSESVSRPYPFPYGFIIGTANADGDCLDCYVITERGLKRGDIVECEALGLMEQSEDGLTDNNVLARLIDQRSEVTHSIEEILRDFVDNVFSHIPAKNIVAGNFLGMDAAEAEIARCRMPLERLDERVAGFLEEFLRWASERPSILAAALVGSQARGTATPSSDVDLVILVHSPDEYLQDTTWTAVFGQPVRQAVEHYGKLTSVRVLYEDELEVEFGFSDENWSVDPGGQAVIEDGLRVLLDHGPLKGL